jgi:hypothetical protein
MANVTPPYLRGFLVPLSIGTNNIWNDESTFTTANERAGDPVPTTNTPMQIVAKGQQTGDSSLTIKTHQPGFAGYTAGFIFTDNQTNKTYGRDPQNAVSRFQNIKFSQTTTTKYRHPSGLDTKQNALLIAHQTTTAVAKLCVVSKLQIDGTITDTTIYGDTSLTTNYNLLSDMCILPDGSFLLCHLAGGLTSVNVRTYTSLNGSTWTLRSKKSLADSLPIGVVVGDTHNIKRIKIAQTNGVVLLLIESLWNRTTATKRNRVIQYASSDLGGSFVKITTDSEIEDHSFHSISLYADKGFFRFGFYGNRKPSYMTLPSAFTSVHTLRTAGALIQVVGATCAGTNDVMTDGDLSIWTDEGSSHHVLARNSGAGGEYRISWSEDTILWRVMGADINGAGRALRTGDDNTTLSNSYGLAWTGKSIVLFQPESTATNNSISMITLGGYSSVTLPQSVLLNSRNAEWNRLSYSFNYPAIDLYSNFAGVTKTSVGGAESLQSGGLFIQNQEFFTVSPTVTGMPTADIIQKGLIVHARIESMTGGNNSTTYRGVNIKLDDTIKDFEADIRVSPNSIIVRDVNGSADLITIGSLSLNTVELIIAMSNSQISIYYHDVDQENNIRTWVDGGSSSALTDGGGGASRIQRIRWGNLQYAGGTFETVWSSLSFAQGFQISGQMHTFTIPDSLMHRAYPTIERFAYVADNVSISTGDGQTYTGDEYTITPDSQFSINNTLYAVSPTSRVFWKSASVLSGSVPEQFIAVKLDPDITVHVDESLPNDIVGIHLSGYNFRSAKLEYYRSATWTVLDSFNTAINSKCNVSGRTVRGENTAANKPYFKYNECAGWRVRVQGSGEGYAWRTVLSNSEGVFGGTATTTKQAVLLLDEAITISGITNTVIELVPNSMTLLVNLNGQRLEALGLRIPTQDTLENNIRIGLMHLGSVVIPGKQYQRGRTISIDSGTESTETQSGVIYARNYRPSRRTFRIAWTEGIDITDLQGNNPNPDYWIANIALGEPIAIANDVPDLLQGLLDFLQGEKTPIVYLPLIVQNADHRELHRENEQALVLLQGEVQVENILGDENVDVSGELTRVATMTLQEVL